MTPKHLKRITNTKRRPRAGDVFAYQVTSDPTRYFFGRVIATDTKIGGLEGVVLIYLYCASSFDKTTIPPLHPDDLLVPPRGTNVLPWEKGYFEVVASGPVAPDDRLPRHSFRDPVRGWYFDEYGARVPPSERAGIYAMDSYMTLDEAIAEAIAKRS